MLLLILFSGILFSACSTQPQLPKLSPDATILAFGDSLTYGSGVEKSESYPVALSRLTGFKVINAGVPGEVTDAGLSRLADVLEEVQPTLMILCHGGNDILRKQDMNKAEDNLRAMIGLAKQQGISVILIAVPRPGLLLSPPAFYGQIAKAMKVPVEADVLSDVLSKRALKSDQIHPNREGYQMIAESIYKLMKERGLIR